AVAWGSGLLSPKLLRLPEGFAEWMMAATVAAWAAVPDTAARRTPRALLVAAALGLWWTSRRRALHALAHDDAGRAGEPGPWRLAILVFTIAMLALLILGFSNWAIAWGNALGTFA